MKKYKSQKEFEADIKDGIFYSEESIDITDFSLQVECSIKVLGNIDARDIKARDINAWNIKAGNIKAWDINAGNIDAWDINAWNIKAWDINAGDIDARDINAGDINAGNIDAGDINYYAVAFAYKSIKVKSIKGSRENAKHFVLDGEIEIKDSDEK